MSDLASTAAQRGTNKPPVIQSSRDFIVNYQERFAFAAEAAQIGYWFCNLPFDRLVWDARVKEHFWLPPDAEVSIDLFYDRLHPDDRQRTRQAIENSIETATHYDIEYRTVSPAGKLKWIRAIGRAAYDDFGKPIRFDGITREITALKEAEDARDRAKEALIRNEKLALIGRLSAAISHEINNPLAAVTNLLYMIELSARDPEVVRHAKMALDEVKRISEIVTHTLAFNRKAGESPSESLSQLLDSALSIYHGRFRQSNIRLKCDYSGVGQHILLPSDLRQAFANLIGNALDALAGKGTLIVRARMGANRQTGEPGLRVSLADTGTGMDQATQQQLFEPFFSTKGDRGTGLGLWITREILGKYGATIRTKSRIRDGASGTVFSVWIPARIPSA